MHRPNWNEHTMYADQFEFGWNRKSYWQQQENKDVDATNLYTGAYASWRDITGD